MYREAACVYSPYPVAASAHAHQRYVDNRSPYRAYEERYYPARDPAAYPGYLSSDAAIQSAAHASTPRLAHVSNISQSHSLGDLCHQKQCEYLASGGGIGGDCGIVGYSKSSSTEASPHAPIHDTAPGSHKSESSASDVDVGSEEYTEKQNQHQKRRHRKSQQKHQQHIHNVHSQQHISNHTTTTSFINRDHERLPNNGNGDAGRVNEKCVSSSSTNEECYTNSGENNDTALQDKVFAAKETAIHHSVIIRHQSNVTSTVTSSDTQASTSLSSDVIEKRKQSETSIESSQSSTSLTMSNTLSFVHNSSSLSIHSSIPSSSSASTSSSTASIHLHPSHLQQHYHPQQHDTDSSNQDISLNHLYRQQHAQNQNNQHSSDFHASTVSTNSIIPIAATQSQSTNSAPSEASTHIRDKFFTSGEQQNINTFYDLASSSDNASGKFFNLPHPVSPQADKLNVSSNSVGTLCSFSSSTSSLYDMSSNNASNKLYELPSASETNKLYELSSDSESNKLYELSTVSESNKLYEINDGQHLPTDAFEASGADLESSIFYDTSVDNDKTVPDATNGYRSCVKAAACVYGNYTPANIYQSGALQAQRSFPVISQPGYTSVIVDPQQYHVANGYAVH